MKRYNILYINEWSSCHSGTPTSLLDLLRKLDRNLFEPYVMCSSTGALTQELEKLDVPVLIEDPLSLSRGKIMGFCHQIPRMCSLFKKYGIDLIHINTPGWRKSYSFAGILLGIPLIQHIRSLASKTYVKSDFTLNLMTRIIANSNATANTIIRGKNKLADKVVTIYNAVDLDRFNTSETVRTEFGCSEDDLVVGIVGQIWPLKGVRFFIEMIPRVLSEFQKARFLIVGRDAITEEGYTEQMKEYAEKLGVSQNVIFTGFRKDIPEVMNSLDVLVLASLSEAFGKVVIEAMAAGKCVVATKVGGVPEIINDERIGTLVLPENSDMLADAVLKYLRSEDLRRETGKLAKKSVEERFSLVRIIGDLQNIYLELVEGR